MNCRIFCLLLMLHSSFFTKAQTSAQDYTSPLMENNAIMTNGGMYGFHPDSVMKQLKSGELKTEEALKAIDNAHKILSKMDNQLARIEQKQSIQEIEELNVFISNYETAVINLVSMDREIRPLTLFNATREFIFALTQAGNPMQYPGYQQWYTKFYDHVEKQKQKDPVFGVLSHVLSLSGDVAKSNPLGGPVTDILFSGITQFVQSIGSGKKALREESEKMFLITATLAQMAYDQKIIEYEWKNITLQLESLQQQYESLLKDNLQLIDISETEFRHQFTKENDAHKRYEYLGNIKQKAATAVHHQKLMSEKDWKEMLYYRMVDIQTLKVKFGSVTGRIKENIQRYQVLINKYKGDVHIGAMISTTEAKLREVSEIFDRSFEPEEYVSSASRMYKVH